MIPKTKHTTNPNTILSTNLSDKPTTITMIIKDWSRPILIFSEISERKTSTNVVWCGEA
jgi:hypothetical protein